MWTRTRVIAPALALSLCCATVYAADTKNIDKTLALSATGVITLDAQSGSIQVRTWDRAEVEIHVQIVAGGVSADDRRRFNETTVEINGSTDGVSIRSTNPENDGWSLLSWLINFGWGNRPELRYTITAPRTARWKISDHNSTTEIHDVNAAVEIDTHNGRVRMVNQGGPIELTMHNGDAHVDFASFTRDSHIETHNGDVELTLPASTRFDLHSDGHNMSVHSDFPVMVRSSSGSRDRALNGPVNGGGPGLWLTSHNGTFRVSSK
jgi:hypothetical protein